MIIQPTSLAALTWAGAASGTTAQSWRIGSVLSARPLGVSADGFQVLQIGALTVETAIGGNAFPAQFQVRVLSLGAQPVLEMMLSNSLNSVAQRGLRERLPQQNGYAPLLAALGALSERPMLRQLSPALRAALAALEQSIPTPADITHGEGLRLAISRSGLFFESLLAHPDGHAAGAMDEDWKGSLLRLLGLLDRRPPTAAASSRNDTPPPLLKRGLQPQQREPLQHLDGDEANLNPLLDRLRDDVKSALARVEVAQLEASALPGWMIEIPLHGEGGHDVLQLQLASSQDDVDGSVNWTIGFALDLPTLGPIQGELKLRALRLSVRLWAERSPTAQQLERQFMPLRQRLAACGLLLDQLSCQVGRPEPPGRYSAVLLQATA